MGATAIDCHMSQVISLLIHQSRAHMGHIQYEHDLLQLASLCLFIHVHKLVECSVLLSAG
jgi:hypothetical protein